MIRYVEHWTDRGRYRVSSNDCAFFLEGPGILNPVLVHGLSGLDDEDEIAEAIDEYEARHPAS